MNGDSSTVAAGDLPLRAADAAGPAMTIEHALARLERSRTRLRESLAPAVPSPASKESGFSFHPVQKARAWLRSTPWGGLLDPVASAVSDELLHWWQRQSWRQSAVLVKDALSTELSPLVRRYPIAAVLVTAGAAAVFVGSGVWRWRTVRRSAGQLGSQLRRVFVRQLTNPAVLSVLLGAVVSYLAPKRQHADVSPSASGNANASASAAVDDVRGSAPGTATAGIP